MKAIYFIYYLKHKEGLCLSPNSSDQYLDLVNSQLAAYVYPCLLIAPETKAIPLFAFPCFKRLVWDPFGSHLHSG